MKKFLVPVCLVIGLVGVFIIWHLGYQGAEQEVMKNESKDIAPTVDHSPDVSPELESTEETSKNDTIPETETRREDLNTGRIKNTDSLNGNGALDEKKEQEQKSLSVEDIEAAAAFEAYVKTEVECKLATVTLTEVLKIRPIDWQRVKSANSNLKNARLQREKALQNLAVYSEAAAEILAADEAHKAQAKKEFDQITTDSQKRFEEMQKQIAEILNTLSPEQQRALWERIPELKELLPKD